jgi:EAL domain-containing protein (putative c-di-GMP-specific phosphodiesterase class I)
LLSELRCDIAQGYFIGRPMPASQLVFDSTLVASGDAALVG